MVPKDKKRTLGLRRAAFDGLVWGMGGKTLVVGGTLLVLMVTSRTLTATQFGVFAVATIFADLSLALSTSTFGVALIQTDELSEETSRAGLVAFASTAVFLSVGALLSAPLLERIFGSPGLAEVLVAMSLAVPLRVMSGYYGALLQRNLDLRFYQATQNVPQFVGGCGLTVIGALAGWGVWCLVAGYALSAAMEFVMTLARARPIHRFPQRMQSVVDLLKIGSGSAANRMANFAAVSLDRAVVGVGLGAGALGIYSRAYGLMMVPVKLLGMAISQTLLSVFSRLQGDDLRLRDALLKILNIQPMLFIPIGVGLIVATPALVLVVLGDGWSQVVLPAQILFSALAARLGYVAPEQAAVAVGEAWGSAGRQLVFATLVCLGALSGLAIGLVGVAVGVTLALVVLYCLSLRRAAERFQFSKMALIGAHLRAIAVCLPGLLLASMGGQMLSAWTQSELVASLVKAVIYSSCSATIIIIAPRAWMGEAVGDIRTEALDFVRCRIGRTSSRPT
jgi:O-antigen/teichoic acid export membrane protein